MGFGLGWQNPMGLDPLPSLVVIQRNENSTTKQSSKVPNLSFGPIPFLELHGTT